MEHDSDENDIMEYVDTDTLDDIIHDSGWSYDMLSAVGIDIIPGLSPIPYYTIRELSRVMGKPIDDLLVRRD